MVLRKYLLLLFLSVVCGFYSMRAEAGLMKNQTITIDGQNRTFDLYVPDHKFSKKMPLVVLLHGHSGDADAMTGENGRTAPYKLWLSKAEREGIILLIPDGVIGPDKERGWNDCRGDATSNPSTDDVGFIETLVTRVAEKFPVDLSRVYATGTSNGGGMSYRLAQESSKFQAIAAIVAAMPKYNVCRQPASPISVLIMNGTDDPILPFDGGGVGRRNKNKSERGTSLSAADSVRYWLAVNSITSSPIVKIFPDVSGRDGGFVTVKQYVSSTNGTEVLFYEVGGGGHTEPSLTEHYGRLYRLIVGSQNKDIEMVDAVWKFFARH